jgi:hypothetical protein
VRLKMFVSFHIFSRAHEHLQSCRLFAFYLWTHLADRSCSPLTLLWLFHSG